MKLPFLNAIWLSIVLFSEFSTEGSPNCKIKKGGPNQVIVDCDSLSTSDFPMDDIPSNVTDLYLRDNKLNSFGSSNLSEYMDLQKLYLSRNLFTTIPVIVCTRLTKLVIDSNQIVNLTFPDEFDCPTLREITISSNPIRNIGEDAFSKIPDLQTLTMTSCPLSVIHPNAFKSATYLQGLSMALCRNCAGDSFIDTIQALSPLRSLISLDLSGSFSSPTNLTKEVFNGSYKQSLLYLYLERNNFFSIGPDSFASLAVLKQLFLKGSKITHLKARAFAGMKQLNQLDLSDNLFGALPSKCFEGSNKLVSLFISGCNQFTSFRTNAFAGMSSLNALTMNDMTSLTTLSATYFQGLDSLTILNIASGNIRFIAKGAFSPFKNSLRVLDISSQQLTDFTGADKVSESFYDFTALENLTIIGNPFNCSCLVNSVFLSWLRQTQTNVRNRMSMMCTSPESMKNVSLVAVDCSITPETSWWIYLLTIVCCFALAICIIGATFFLTQKCFKSRSSGNDDGLDPLLNTGYASDQPPTRGWSNCFELITLAFNREPNPATRTEYNDEENIFDATTEESNNPTSSITPSVPTTNFNANILLICHSDDAGWARSIRSQLIQTLPQGHQCKLISDGNCLSQETLTQPEHLLIVLSVSLIRAQTTVEMLNILIAHITARHSHILVRKPPTVIREALNEQAKHTGTHNEFIDLNENEWIRCDGEAEMENIVDLVRSHLSVA